MPSYDRISAYYYLVAENRSSDYKKAFHFTHLGVTLAKEAKDVRMEGNLYYQMCAVYWTIGSYDSALVYSNKALDFAQIIKDEGLEAKGENLKSLIYKDKNMPEKALEHAFNVLKYYEKVNYKEGIVTMLLNIGNIYMALINGEMAKTYYQRHEKIAEEDGDKEQLGNVYVSYVEIYLWEENLPVALEYAQKAIDIFRELSLLFQLSVALDNIAFVYAKMEDYQNLLKCSEESLRIAEELGMERSMINALNSLALVQFSLGQYAESETTALRALETDSEGGPLKKSFLWRIAQANIMMNNHARAMAYLTKYDDHLFSYLQEDYRQRASEMEIKYETEKKEIEIQKQRQMIARHTMERGPAGG